MFIDNSAANEFRTCPRMYFNKRLLEGDGIEPKPSEGTTPLALGSRVHELLEEHYKEGIHLYEPSANEKLETEAQMIIEAYKAHYPQEDFDVVDVERTIKVQIPGSNHVYTGKIDLTFRNRENGMLNILDHKTEKRSSRSNSPQRWAADDQASLYLWAAKIIYGEPIERFTVNILKRPSPAFQEPPSFPERQKLERTKEQIAEAVRDITITADTIEQYIERFKNESWPSWKKSCVQGWGLCDFYTPCTFGWSRDIREIKFQKRTPYLDLAGVPILQ